MFRFRIITLSAGHDEKIIKGYSIFELTCCFKACVGASSLYFKSSREFIVVMQLRKKIIGFHGSLKIRIPSATFGLLVIIVLSLHFINLLFFVNRLSSSLIYPVC